MLVNDMKEKILYYSRQAKLIGPNGQERLSNAKVLVIGAGGLGCPVLLYLSAMGIGRLGIIDNDCVDLTNLHRQILYSVSDIGGHKAELAAKKTREQNPNIEVVSFVEKLTSDNVESIFKNFDIIVDCSDNFRTKFLVHDACYFQKKKLVQSSIYQFEGNLHVFNFSEDYPEQNSPCLRCLWSEEPEDGCTGTCAEVGVLGVTAGVLGTLQASEVSKLVLNNNPMKNGEGLFADLLSNDFEIRRWKKSKDCHLCSSTPRKPVNDLRDFEINLEEVDSSFTWIDLRDENEVKEFAINHIEILNINSSLFDSSHIDPTKKYLLICKRGIRSTKLAKDLRKLGHTNIYSLNYGIAKLKNNGCV